MPETRWRRNSIRYPGYDYRQPGLVFVTICTYERQQLFGNVLDFEMRLSEPGVEVMNAWSRLGERFPDAVLDEFIVMPDHLHGIIMTGTDPDPETIRKAIGIIVNSFKNSVLASPRTVGRATRSISGSAPITTASFVMIANWDRCANTSSPILSGGQRSGAIRCRQHPRHISTPAAPMGSEPAADCPCVNRNQSRPRRGTHWP